MQTMTALEAFRASADADVYVLIGQTRAYLTGGCQTGYGLLLTVDTGCGGQDLDLIPCDRPMVTWVYR